MPADLGTGGSPGDRTSGFIEGALATFVIQTVIGAFSQSEALRQNMESEIFFGLALAAPDLVTLAGFLGALRFGGILGAIGYPMGVIGASMVIPPSSPEAGLVLSAIGGCLTWAGVKMKS